MPRRPIIIIDTREQEPYVFDSERAASERRGLKTGDYSIDQFEDCITVERKSLEDFISTVIHNSKRFAQELKRLRTFKYACLVVECNLREVITGEYSSNANPNSILGKVLSIMIDYGIPVYFCSDRAVAIRFVENFLLKCYEKERGKHGNKWNH